MPVADYTSQQVGNVLVVQIDAENLLGINEVNRIGSSLNLLAKSQTGNMVLDLTKVRYAGSAALGMLVSISKVLQDRGGRLMLIGTQHLEMLFKVSRTIAMFEIAGDLQTALALLKFQKK